MTIEQIIRETRLWPSSQVDKLVHALTSQVKPSASVSRDVVAVARVRELSKKIDRVWEGTDIDVPTEDMVASLHESRHRLE